MYTVNETCNLCEEEQSFDEFIQCDECEFIGHSECLMEHFMSKHEMTENELNSDDSPDDYLGGTEVL